MHGLNFLNEERKSSGGVGKSFGSFGKNSSCFSWADISLIYII